MGMFDKWENFTDHFQEGQIFNLEAAKTQELNTAEYGVQTAALLKIEGKWFSLFGAAIVSQIERMESGDLPARVQVVRGKNKRGQDMKMLIPEGQDIPTEEVPF